MDPKSIANLDPKLRETYERVLGSSPASSPAAASNNQAAPAASGTSPAPIPESTPPPDLSAPVSPEPQLSTSPPGVDAPPETPASTPYTPADLGISGASQPGSETPDMQPLASPASVAQASQGSNSLIKVLYIAGGIIFFIVYVFFWIRIFNYQLPF